MEFAAEHAIDLDLETESRTTADSEGVVWFKLTLDQVNCVQQVIQLSSDGGYARTWTCSDADCSICDYSKCSKVTVTVSTEGAYPDILASTSDCKYGDTLKLERGDDRTELGLWEIAVISKQGDLLNFLILYNNYRIIILYRTMMTCD